jgi:phosphate-selective porin OprO and OprP
MILLSLLLMQGPTLAPADTGEGHSTLPTPPFAESGLNIFGRLQQDFGWIDDDAFGTPDGSEARRARIGVSGNLAEGIDFKMEVDFASFDGSGAAFTDAYMKFSSLPVGVVQVGHFKEPFSLNELTSSRFITFTERNDTFAPARNSGIMASDKNDDLTWQLGAFWDTSKNLDTGGNSAAYTGRVVYRPVYADKGASLVHLGAAISVRENQSNAYSYGTRSGIHMLAGKTASATMTADGLTLVGLEGAWQEGSMHAEVEYVQADGDSDSFTTWYVQGGFFLTGEHRGYKTSSAAFNRVKPNTPWGESGNGAWEIAGRINTVDLSDSAADEAATQLALALNWYLTAYTRISFSVYSGDSDVPGRESVTGALVRFGFDF